VCFLQFQLVSELVYIYIYVKDMEEGFATNKPPIFRWIKYNYWKERIIAHFEYIHIDFWDVVENKDYIPYDD